MNYDYYKNNFDQVSRADIFSRGKVFEIVVRHVGHGFSASSLSLARHLLQ